MTQDTETTEATAQATTENAEQDAGAEEAAKHVETEEGDEATSPAEADGEERAALEAELAEARGALDEAQAVRARLEADLAAAVESCRAALLASAPELPAELVQGGTVAELEASFESAKAMAERVRRQVESEAAQERVPAGAPPRRGVDASALTSQQKILLGLRRLAGE